MKKEILGNVGIIIDSIKFVFGFHVMLQFTCIGITVEVGSIYFLVLCLGPELKKNENADSSLIVLLNVKGYKYYAVGNRLQ